MKKLHFISLSILALTVAACGGDDDHGHPHDEDGGHSHAEEAGHDDHGDDHGHGHGGGVVVTDFTDQTELFVEYPPLAVGRASPFAAHFTRLDTFAAVDQGTVSVRLTGGGHPDEIFRVPPSDTAGIFRPVATPEFAGQRRLTLELSSRDVNAFHDLGTVEVFTTVEAADASLPEEEEDGMLIPFLKEQQWKVDFATAPVETKTLSASVAAPGILEPAPGGDARITAPTDGIVLSPADGAFPQIGDKVEAGQIIARLAPQLGGEQDYASIVAQQRSAEASYRAASADLSRAQSLLGEGAVPQRRVDEARAAATEARAQLDAANARMSALEGSASQAGFAVRAPVAGRIAQVNVGNGQYVTPGDALFRIIDAQRLRMTAQVAEVDAATLGQPNGAWFMPLGSETAVELADHDGRLIAASTAVDPVTRTVPVVFEFSNTGETLRAGTSVTARVRTGQTFEGPAVPVTAIIDDAGQDIVFVMADGENWERRVVRVAVRDGGYAGITTGVEAGERVVSRGAYFVHLAASGPSEAGHGHAH